jgi:hypothetical protein
MPLDRSNDNVYACTTAVVKSIMALSQGVEKAKALEYLELVRNVGMELRNLLGSVDQISNCFPLQVHKEVEMAHKVLSKDMFELVSAMRLAQEYCDTTLDAEYRKSMLACAHILAMDAKNLLDVVDSIRVRYPDLVLPAHLQPQQPTSPTMQQFAASAASLANNSIPSTNHIIHSHTVSQTQYQSQVVHDNENQYQNSPNDCYQNASIAKQQQQQQLQNSSPPASLTNSTTTNCNNQSHAQAQQLYTNQKAGMYDNEQGISQQVKTMDINNVPKSKKDVIKPTPPIRSSGLVSKMRANFQQFEPTNSQPKSTFKPQQAATFNNSSDSMSEQLKIVEDPNEMYSNTSSSGGGGNGIQLPEPASCQIVQENLLANQQKSLSNNLGKS